MPREGTKTFIILLNRKNQKIEIRYAPGGDENNAESTVNAVRYEDD